MRVSYSQVQSAIEILLTALPKHKNLRYDLIKLRHDLRIEVEGRKPASRETEPSEAEADSGSDEEFENKDSKAKAKAKARIKPRHRN